MAGIWEKSIPGPVCNVKVNEEGQLGCSEGERGPTGPTGHEGKEGPTGATGTEGPKGATGPEGNEGKTGATGAQGVKGEAGATGPQGVAGATGPRGVTGETGAKGENGATGATGPVGPASVTRVTGTTATIGPPTAQGEPVGPVTASCPIAETLVGGGAEIVNSGGARGTLADSFPSAVTLGGTWTAEGVALLVSEVGTVTITAYALCAG